MKEHHPLLLAQIAAFYSRWEQIAEVNNEPYTDTTALYKVFLIDRDVSISAVVREWANTYYGQVEPEGDESGLLADFVNLLLQTGSEKAISFAEEHPKVQPEAEEWMLFQTRKERQ